MEIQQQAQQQLATNDELVGCTFVRRFQILELLGKGRISHVYKATETGDKTGKVVALKLINGEQKITVDALKLFESNARLSVQHPNLVVVEECGLSDEGKPWLAQEYLQGETLAVILQKEVYFTPLSATPICEQVLDAVSYIHSKGEMLFNLKPSSILLLKATSGIPFVKITDFGIGKFMLERELDLIGEGDFVAGSPLYMSPEQFKGDRIDSRSDIYSLGCIFYEMLTGRPPHHGLTLLETMDRHLNAAVEFPQEPELPAPLYTVLQRMLSKEPSDRQRSAADVKTELLAAFQGVAATVPARVQSSSSQMTALAAGLVNPRASVPGWKPARGKKGNEPWSLLLACMTVLLLVVMFQQCVSLCREIRARQTAASPLN